MAEDETVDDLLNSVQVETLSPGAEHQLKDEVASGMYPLEVIAQRHRISSVRGYLIAHPWLVPEIAALKAEKSSERSVQERCRVKAAHASEALIVDIVSVVANPTTSAASKIDGFKQLNRMAGVDGLPAATRDNQAQPGTTFQLTINLPDGKSETITTVVEAPDALPAPPSVGA